jgi:hypothetical protein
MPFASAPADIGSLASPAVASQRALSKRESVVELMTMPRGTAG